MYMGKLRKLFSKWINYKVNANHKAESKFKEEQFIYRIKSYILQFSFTVSDLLGQQRYKQQIQKEIFTKKGQRL